MDIEIRREITILRTWRLTPAQTREILIGNARRRRGPRQPQRYPRVGLAVERRGVLTTEYVFHLAAEPDGRVRFIEGHVLPAYRVTRGDRQP